MNGSNTADLMSQTIEKVRQMVDVNTIIGNPITTAEGTTLIPVNKVSIGLGSGGSDLSRDNSFGGGGGAGISITPVCFVVISNGDTKILPINGPASSTADRAIEMVPEVINKVAEMFSKKENQE